MVGKELCECYENYLEMIKNKYAHVRLVYYKARAGHKRARAWRKRGNYNNLIIRSITMMSPNLSLLNETLVIENRVDREFYERDKGYIRKALLEEAENLYPEFKNNIRIEI